VPACRPSLAAYRPSVQAYSWKKVLRHEFHGLLVIAAGAFVLDAARRACAPARGGGCAVGVVLRAAAVLFVIFAALKRARVCSRADPWPFFRAATSTRRFEICPAGVVTATPGQGVHLRGFPDAVAFVARLVPGSEAADHHPDLTVSYRRVTVAFSTHSEGGVTAKDLAGARLADSCA